MPYSNEVKEIAYVISHPIIWESYSGKSKSFKQRIDIARKSALEKAQKIVDATYDYNLNNAYKVDMACSESFEEQSKFKEEEIKKLLLDIAKVADSACKKRQSWIAARTSQIKEVARKLEDVTRIVYSNKTQDNILKELKYILDDLYMISESGAQKVY